MKLGNLNKQSQGFTLMEVSLVLAIVSTVVALAVAALGNSKADALNALDPSNLSPALVTGYVNNGGTWVSPYASSAGASSILW